MPSDNLLTDNDQKNGALTDSTIADNSLTKAELNTLRQRSNMLASRTLAINWAIIIGAFAMAIVWPNPLTIILSILLIGGRQLGLGILTHDCCHNALFETGKTNELVGHWICGGPINLSFYDYRKYHLQHHRYAGTEQDPDRIFVEKYPVSKASLQRKLLRDITGRTGVRDELGRLKQFDLNKQMPWLLFNGVLILTLISVNSLWAYLLWWAAELFVLPLLLRIRQIGEHGVARDRSSLDPRENTGTTLASMWERLFIAPNHVNYHVEHHCHATVPPYNLSKVHQLLKTRGYYDGYQCIRSGYFTVLRDACR